MSKYGSIGQTKGGRTAHGLLPPFDPAEDKQNWAEEKSASLAGEQAMINAADESVHPHDAGDYLERAATIAEANGRTGAASAYRKAALDCLNGRVAEARSALGWEPRAFQSSDEPREEPKDDEQLREDAKVLRQWPDADTRTTRPGLSDGMETR